tara:strand:+ start:219 stop:506 length:288 start_codon:yes stop_codon:yes gene_type:complete
MKSEILIQSVLKEIEIITKRISNIKNVFYQTNCLVLRKRLSKEYLYHLSKFEGLKSKVLLFKIKNKDNITYSSILIEKYYRCEKLIYQNSNLFFV